MHSLETECLELNAAGLIDEATAARAAALERGSIFSVAAGCYWTAVHKQLRGEARSVGGDYLLSVP